MKIISNICAALLSIIFVNAYAQVPPGINFQAVLRTDNGTPLVNQPIIVSITVGTNANLNNPIYRERHSINTNDLGQFNLIIGNGTVQLGQFLDIPWNGGAIFLNATVTLNNGKVISLPVQQLSSVPFAYYSDVAQRLAGPNDISVTNELIQDFSFNNNTLHIKEGGIDFNVNLSTLKDDADASVTNELQTLSLNGNTLEISSGNSVDLTGLKDDADANPTNELQHLSVNGSTLSLTNSGTTIDLAPIGLAGASSLQAAYNAGNSISLGTNADLRINANAGAPIFTVKNQTANVGIGTVSPSATLDVVSSSPSSVANFRLANSDATHLLSLYPGKSDDPNPYLGVAATDPLRFGHLSGGVFNERFRISANGNIGIGTINPLHRIHLVANTTPTTQPELLDYESAVVLEATEANTTALLSVGFASILRASSETNYAILGTSKQTASNNRGVFGLASGATTDNIGVYGLSIGGGSNENIGVRGFAGGTTTNYGVLGGTINAGANNYGGYFHGRYGTTVNYGIYANATTPATNNYGVYATASGGTNNYAGYFEGPVAVNGSANISGTTTITGSASVSNNASVGGTLNVAGTTTFQGTVNFPSSISIQNGVLRKGGQQVIDVKNGSIYAGTNAGDASTGIGTSYRNIGLGQNVLQLHTTGSDNIVVGWNNLDDMVTGTRNTSIGMFSMDAVSGELNGNTAVGTETMQFLNGSNYNTSVGSFSMENYASGNYNVAVGFQALDGPGGGSSNTALGEHALAEISTGSYNVGVGSNAGNTITTGSSNVAIGRNSGLGAGTISGVAIGANAFTSQDYAIVLGEASNDNVHVGIGTSSPTHKLHVNGNALIEGPVNATAFNLSSDYRLKTNIASLEQCLETIQKIQGVSYNWKSNSEKSKQYGVIAQEVEKVIPEIVATDQAGFKSVNYTALIPFLIEAIKSQQQQIEALKTQNILLSSKLASEMAQLSAQVRALNNMESKVANSIAEKE